MTKATDRVNDYIKVGNRGYVAIGMVIVEQLERIADALEKQNAGMKEVTINTDKYATQEIQSKQFSAAREIATI